MLGQNVVSQLPQSVSHLESLPILANRVELACASIDQFINRFYNGPEAESAYPSGDAGKPVGHKGQLERLRLAVDRLDNAILSLSDIG